MGEGSEHPSGFNPDKEASWNSAKETALRLAYWIQLGNTHYYAQDYVKYKDCLMIFFKEICSKLNDGELKRLKIMRDDILEELEKFQKEISEYTDEDEINFSSTFPSKLDEFDIHLRRVADNKGLLIPNKGSIYGSE